MDSLQAGRPHVACRWELQCDEVGGNFPFFHSFMTALPGQLIPVVQGRTLVPQSITSRGVDLPLDVPHIQPIGRYRVRPSYR